MTYNFENRLWYIRGGATASFVYDADGNRVKSTVGGVTTIYIAGVFEFIENGDTDKITKYYDGNAMRRSGYGADDGVFYLLRDHLNSSSAIVNQSGNTLTNGNQYYYPYGGNRGSAFLDVTTKRFTGQYHESSLPGGEGLSYYNARWYDPKLGRFLSADTIVPGPANPQAFNRYSYVFNNPLKYTDPTGHSPCLGCIVDLRPLVAMLEDLGWANPLAPAYMIPAALGTYQKLREAQTGEAPEPSLALTADWYFEVGDQKRYIGSDSKITQTLRSDKGVVEARQAFIEGGRQSMMASDRSWHRYRFGLRDAAREFGDVIDEGDWSTSFLGGYQVEVLNRGDSLVEFRVHNTTGWTSATRVWGFSFKENEDRTEYGPGGNLDQVYIWQERIPQ